MLSGLLGRLLYFTKNHDKLLIFTKIGQPFISVLEAQQLNGSNYYTEYEKQFYFIISATTIFGVDNNALIKYPGYIAYGTRKILNSLNGIVMPILIYT